MNMQLINRKNFSIGLLYLYDIVSGKNCHLSRPFTGKMGN